MKKNMALLIVLSASVLLNGCGKKEQSEPKKEIDSTQHATIQKKSTAQKTAVSTQKKQSASQRQSVTTAPDENPLESLGTAPDFILSKLDGTTLSLNELKGKIVLIDFWATWCPPCRKMIPELKNLYKKYQSQGLEIIGISLDDKDNRETVKSFVENVKIDYPIVIGTHAVSNAYGKVTAIPTSFIIDANGVIRDKHVGDRTFGGMERVIKKLLAEK